MGLVPAEQELSLLTGADQPDAAQMQTNIPEIGNLWGRSAHECHPNGGGGHQRSHT